MDYIVYNKTYNVSMLIKTIKYMLTTTIIIKMKSLILFFASFFILFTMFSLYKLNENKKEPYSRNESAFTSPLFVGLTIAAALFLLHARGNVSPWIKDGTIKEGLMLKYKSNYRKFEC